MKFLRSVIAELLGMFIDDGALALASVALIAVVALAVEVAGTPPLASSVLLLAGCLAILLESVRRAARKKLGR
ncbi:hypothetical protein GCM10007301_07740 [Azorhizobium oxalatiphilum]|uniref:Uncharacterized protein n=1 Tax=Azorhizobium oxalatiphilum TaxID=980631 RepID=A0A917BLT3_9HYPH|nr:hypothetical protein [Azorhizobium oxalatiphilum]GGF50803.1 hypothetical protein GCM10007301_07740 [Azorhizobium oxalatiphilum]